MGEQFLWVIYPYITLTVFFIGHIYRYNTDQLGWTAKSSELLEKSYLKWGSNLFHFGIMAVIGGHVAGLLIPKEFFETIGVTDHLYHQGAVYGGGFAGIVTLTGMVILTIRRFGHDRVAASSSFGDKVVAVLLLAEIILGMMSTMGGGGFDYRTTIAPWLRGLLIFQPEAALMSQVPVYFKLHVLLAFAIFGLWPFTRLVHVWSMPVEYLTRAYIQYRRHDSKLYWQ